MTTLLQKKICLLGDFSVGKTSLIERYVYDRFSGRYLSTIGVKISRKSIDISPDITVNMLIWDLAGSEEFSGVQASYLQGARGAILVCDLTRPETLTSLTKYHTQLNKINPNIPIVLLGNKIDLTDDLVLTKAQLDEQAAHFNTISVMMTSAKTGTGVEKSFSALAKHLA